MNKVLPILLLAVSAVAAAPARDPYPATYQASPCDATAEKVCQSYPQYKLVEYAKTMRGYDVSQDWVDAHWDEMRALFKPLCAKAGACFSVPGNDSIFCVEAARDEFLSTCNKFPAGSYDRDQCTMFAMTYYVGIGSKKEVHQRAQSCAKKQPAAGVRTMEAWIANGPFEFGRPVQVQVHALDAERRVPVRAKVTIETGSVKSGQGPIPTTFYPITWRPTLKRVPNADGHRDVAIPTVTIEAEGYAPVTMPMPVSVSTMLVEMTPPASALKPGKNEITITARDATTGKPVRARVMAGETILGNTNTPLLLELEAGGKRPEIWVTSLYDLYNDVVVVK